MSVVVGVDLHKRSVELVGFSERGPQYFGSMGREAAMEKLGEIGPQLIVVEAVTAARAFQRDLRNANLPAVLVSPDTVKCKRGRRKRHKTDKSDAEYLAQYAWELEHGIASATVAEISPDIISLRHLTRSRQALVSERTGLMNLAHSILTTWGIQFPRTKLRTKRGRGKALTLIMPHHAGTTMVVLFATIEFLTSQIQAMEKELRSVCAEHEIVEALTGLVGIGPVLAVTIYVEIGHIGRFARDEKLRAYAGLVPSYSQSGEKAVQGPLRVDCNHRLRGAFIQAAHCAVMARDPLLYPHWKRVKAKYEQTAIAHVSIARKICDRVYRMWRDHELQARDAAA